MSKERKPIFGKHVTCGPWCWKTSGHTDFKVADIYVNYYAFGILVHSVTVTGASWDVAVGLGLPKKHRGYR